MKALAVLPLLLLPALAHAQVPASPQIMADVHAGDFQDAAQLAAQTGDPLVAKLVTFFELTDPGGGTSDQITQFQAQNPDWPEQALLSLRAKQAAGTTTPPRQTPEFLLQAEALFDAKQYPEAAQLWAAQGTQAFDSATPNEQPLFWPDAAELARTLLLQNDAKDAYAVVLSITPLATSSEQLTDRDFLAGFLALRFLHQPTQAATWFRQLQAASPAVITQARAWYWLGRAEQGAAAQSDYEHAAAFPSTYYGQLASYALGESPIELANRIKSAQPPDLSLQDALDFSLMELPRAGVLLAQMGDNKDAAIFLNRLGAIAGDDKTRAMAAKLALSLSLPQSAVAIARSSGAAGQMLLPDGWPMPYTPPSNGPLEPSVADGIMRQESSFDASVISNAGAMGLMQLMPETARRTARKYSIPYANPFNPNQNMALGEAYLAQEVANFGNCLPLAIAAYNAGPTNVARWISDNGDPELGSAAGGADIIDWIEEIPYNETRNYVQRVSENITIYRALLNGSADLTVTPWLKN
jgi:soluble lytic murein transglycosylase